MTQKFANNARSRLVGSLNNSATTFTVESATADTFPIANTTDWLNKLNWFKAVLEKDTGEVEIIHVGVRNSGSGVFSNVLRGREGTTALSFVAGATVGLRITAEDIERALAGEYDELQVDGAANIDGKLTHNGIDSRPVPVGGVIMYSGAVSAIPAGWQLCDGTNGTPDLRDKFVIGARQDDAGVAKTNVTSALTTSGGSKDAINVAHTHGVAITTANESAPHTHAGSTASAGNHSHTAASGQFLSTGIASAPGFDGGNTYNPIGVSGTNTTGAHTHTLTVENNSVSHTHAVTGDTASAGASGTNANLPPYFALAFIMCMGYA